MLSSGAGKANCCVPASADAKLGLIHGDGQGAVHLDGTKQNKSSGCLYGCFYKLGILVGVLT